MWWQLDELGLTDCVGQPLAIGDYVTAVWDSGELAVFSVIGSANRKRNHFSRKELLIKLKREFKSSEQTQDKAVFRSCEQVTRIEKEWAILHLLVK